MFLIFKINFVFRFSLINGQWFLIFIRRFYILRHFFYFTSLFLFYVTFIYHKRPSLNRRPVQALIRPKKWKLGINSIFINNFFKKYNNVYYWGINEPRVISVSWVASSCWLCFVNSFNCVLSRSTAGRTKSSSPGMKSIIYLALTYLLLISNFQNLKIWKLQKVFNPKSIGNKIRGSCSSTPKFFC
jgi:hypothetical protein